MAVDELRLNICLASGREVACVVALAQDTVQSVLSRLPAGQDDASLVTLTLLFEGRNLDPQASFAAIGIGSDSVLTLIRTTLAWHLDQKGQLAEIDEDGRTVRRLSADTKDNAIVISTAPMRTFRLRLIEDTECRYGGLEFGFITTTPEDLPAKLPNKLDKLPQTWISDSVGNLIANQEWKLGHQWQSDSVGAPAAPELLKAGDVVECTAGNGGRLRIVVNGFTVADWPADIPDEVALHPIVNIFGKAAAVELL